MLCKHCNHDSNFVCQTCGVVLDVAELVAEKMEQHIIRPLDLAYYLNEEKEISFFDCAIVDRVMPHIRAASSVILLFFINNTKGGSNVPWEDGFTYQEIMAGTGIKSRATVFESLAELGDGLPATKHRAAIHGWNLIIHTNKHKKSKHIRGNRWKLNTEAVIEGVKHKLFNAGVNAPYFMMHPYIINELFPTMTPNQVVIFMFVYRMTIGFRREWNSITYNYFTGARREVEGQPAETPKRQSGLTSYGGVKAVVQQLVDRGLIFVEDGDDPRNGRIYSLNKDLFITIGTRGQLNQDARSVESDARSVESRARSVESDARSVTPPNLVLNTTPLNEKKDEPTTLPNPPANGDFLQLNSSPLYENGGRDNKTLSEGVPAKRTRKERNDILRNVLHMEISTKIKEILDLMEKPIEQGGITDEELDYAILHKQTDDPIHPKYGPGIYAHFLTKKLDDNGNPYQLLWKNTVAKPNEPDPAPQSPPPPSTNGNGHGAAPYPSPTDAPPLYFENPPEMPESGEVLYVAPPSKTPPPYVSKNGETWEQMRAWEEVKAIFKQKMTHAQFDGLLLFARLERVEDGKIFVISAPTSSIAWLEAKAEDKFSVVKEMQRHLNSVAGHDEWSLRYEVRENPKYGG